MKLSRVFWMPSSETFSIPPVRDFIDSYLRRRPEGAVIVDPFARNSTLGTLRNDINPDTGAEYHMDALDFLKLLGERGVVADFVLFDPPFSPRQVKECYDGIGRAMGQGDALRCANWRQERNAATRLLRPGGVALSFGWNSTGFGTGRGYVMEELLLVNHGSGHNDLICVAERLTRKQGVLM